MGNLIYFDSFGKALNAYHRGEVGVPGFVMKPLTFNLPKPDLIIKEKINQALNAVKAI